MPKPVVASYCADFLKADMQHIHRQITDLRGWQACVITHRRENEALFPWPRKQLAILPKHPFRFFRRLWYRQLQGGVVPASFGEIRDFLYQAYRFDASIVHIYFGHVAVRWLPLLRVCPLPIVVSFHGADVTVGVTREQLRQVFRHAALIVARSQALLDDLSAHGCRPEKLRLQRTGIPVEFWRPPQPPRVIPPPDGSWHFVQAGRFIPKKGIPTTLRAFAEIAKAHPNSQLTLIGDGPLRHELVTLTRTLALTDKVRFTGFLPPHEVRNALHAAHAFIHPSETAPDGSKEGVPNSLLEAMATGLPVLATRHGGISEAVEDGVSGFLAAEKDAPALAAAALDLLADRMRWRSMSEAARSAVVRGFERTAQTAVLERCYDEARAARNRVSRS